MICPHCKAPDVSGRFCPKCGQPLTEKRRWTDYMTKENVVIFAIGLLVALFLFILINQIGPKHDRSPQNVVVTNQDRPESERVKKSRNAAILKADPQSPQDHIVGAWQHYATSVTIDKIGKNQYRWISGLNTYLISFKDDLYEVTADDENFYYFSLRNNDELTLSKSQRKDGAAVKNPAFDEEYTLVRLGLDGRPAAGSGVNKDAFHIIGKTYGQLAGEFGPGTLTVIGGDQYVVFRGDGGNFSVRFQGATVPLNMETADWRVVPLSHNNGDSAPKNHDTEAPKPAPATPTPAPAPPKPPEKEEEKEEPIEIPNPATFPSAYAVATGAVWADIGFLINDCPPSLSVERLGKYLGVAFETGNAPGMAGGYSFYGADQGYFAATYNINDHQYKISGYGKTLVRGKTTIFIEMIA